MVETAVKMRVPPSTEAGNTMVLFYIYFDLFLK